MKKINKRKKVCEQGWKNKGLGISCTTIFSLLHSHTHVWSSLIIDTDIILRVYGLGSRVWGLGFRI